jgi:hypothetical protein
MYLELWELLQVNMLEDAFRIFFEIKNVVFNNMPTIHFIIV